MDNDTNIDKKKKKLKIYYSLLITVICIIGVSFAWFRLYLSQNEDNTLASRTCFNTTLTEDTSKIEITDAFPISDEDGMKQTPFTFTLKNNCSSYVKAYILIDSTYRTNTSTSYLSDNYLKVNVSPKDTTSSSSLVLGAQTLTDTENSSKGYVLTTAYLGANEEKSFDLRIWMDSATTLDQGLNKSWAGKIVVITDASNKPAFADTILADNKVTSPTTTPGRSINNRTLNDIVEETLDVSGSLLGYEDDKDVPKFSLLINSVSLYTIAYANSWVANSEKFDLVDAVLEEDTLKNLYSKIIGKYIYMSTLNHARIRDTDMAGELVDEDEKFKAYTTSLDEIFYVTDATENSITYKTLSSNINKEENILASAEDDYGTSYYFRGNVKNNYVEFANKCWRIVRITGNGSVKLILHNDNPYGVSNPCLSSRNEQKAALIDYSNFNVSADNETYAGFMYGTTGSSDYATIHANVNKSTVLTGLETWYTNNLTSYENKLADTIWCNDKSKKLVLTQSVEQYFTASIRIDPTDGNPTLKCPDDNNGGKLSKFTVNDTTYGNGNLTYKIGLLTADEAAFAGLMLGKTNTATYLQENAIDYSWLTMSPYRYYSSGVTVVAIRDGIMESAIASDNAISTAIRPAIALVPETEVTGSGTSEDPYVVK